MKKCHKTTLITVVVLLLSSTSLFSAWWSKSGYQNIPQGDQISNLAQQTANKFNITEDDELLFLNKISEAPNLNLPDQDFDAINNFQVFLAAHEIAQKQKKTALVQQLLNKMRTKFSTGGRYQ